MTTMSQRSDTTLNAAATESCRRAPPGKSRSGFDGERLRTLLQEPDCDNPAADDDDGREPALIAVYTLVKTRGDEMILCLMRKQERIERWQKSHGSSGFR